MCLLINVLLKEYLEIFNLGKRMIWKVGFNILEGWESKKCNKWLNLNEYWL